MTELFEIGGACRSSCAPETLICARQLMSAEGPPFAPNGGSGCEIGPSVGD